MLRIDKMVKVDVLWDKIQTSEVKFFFVFYTEGVANKTCLT